MLKNLKKISLVIILSSTVLSQMETWHTTRFEKFWFSKFHDMKFREPITFIPFNVKIGYIKYGGENYLHQWKKVIASNENYSSDPLTYAGGDSPFTNISESKNRTMVIAEIDLIRYNFFSKKQNIVDVHFGLGYKFMKSLNGFALEFILMKIKSIQIFDLISFKLLLFLSNPSTSCFPSPPICGVTVNFPLKS